MSDKKHGPVCGYEGKTKEAAGMDLEDMIHLIYIMDAYRELNIAFCGREMMLRFNEP